MTQAYPLQWPDGWPATPDVKRKARHPFVGVNTYHKAKASLMRELAMLGAGNVVISTNLPVRSDGDLYADVARRRVGNPGVAVYFTLNKRSLVMAQDAYADVHANIRSLAMSIEGLRMTERHGGGTMLDRAFQGFVAIAPPSWRRPWREVLGAPEGRVKQVDLAHLYRAAAKRAHPDNGGSDEAMALVNVAYDEAKKELGL